MSKESPAAKKLGATEVHIVGGFHPDLPLDYYEQMMRAIKEKHQDLTSKHLLQQKFFIFQNLQKIPLKKFLAG